MDDRRTRRIFASLLFTILALAAYAVNHSWSERQAEHFDPKYSDFRFQNRKDGHDVPSNEFAQIRCELNAAKSDQGSDEFWPFFFGLRFKVTDSLLVLFTGMLWWSTRKLWLAGERQFEQTKRSVDTLIAAESSFVAESVTDCDAKRPYLVASRYPNSPGMPTHETVRVEISYKLKNYGRSPASVVAFSGRIDIADAKPEMDTQNSQANPMSPEIPSDYNLASQESTDVISISREFDINWSLSNSLVREQAKIWFFGHIYWVDSFRNPQLRVFHWVYDRKSQKFRRYDLTLTDHNWERRRKKAELP